MFWHMNLRERATAELELNPKGLSQSNVSTPLDGVWTKRAPSFRIGHLISTFNRCITLSDEISENSDFPSLSNWINDHVFPIISEGESNEVVGSCKDLTGATPSAAEKKVSVKDKDPENANSISEQGNGDCNSSLDVFELSSEAFKAVFQNMSHKELLYPETLARIEETEDLNEGRNTELSTESSMSENSPVPTSTKKMDFGAENNIVTQYSSSEDGFSSHTVQVSVEGRTIRGDSPVSATPRKVTGAAKPISVAKNISPRVALISEDIDVIDFIEEELSDERFFNQQLREKKERAESKSRFRKWFVDKCSTVRRLFICGGKTAKD